MKVNPTAAKRKAKTPLKTLARLLKYSFSRNKFATACVVFFVLIASAANVTAASRMAIIVEALGSVESTAGLWDKVYPNVIAMAVIYFCGSASSFSYNLIMMYVAQGTLKKLRDEMFTKMQKLPLNYFDGHTHGDLMSLYTNDVDTMRQLLTQTIPQLISSFLTLLFVLGFMIYYSVTLLFVVLVMLVLVIFVTKYVGGKSSKHYIKQQHAIGALNGYVEEMTAGQKVIKVFCHEKTAAKNFKVLNDELYSASKTATAYANVLGPINNNLGYFQYVLVAFTGTLIMALGGEKFLLSLFCANQGGGVATVMGMLVSFLMFSRQFNMPVQQVSQQFAAIFLALAGAERIFEMTDTEPECDDGDITLTFGEYENGKWAWKTAEGEYIPLKGDIRFKDVVFGYTPEKPVLKGISLYAKPGQKIAFVGSTGAGKTTITNLINRFYDISSGEITYDGIDIKRIKKDDLRRSLGVVLQDTHLFTGTVMDNIRYGKLQATDEECISAAKRSCADFFISHLPEGYNTVISGDGSNLSQGQRQLIAIARAMVTDCPVLILDEATSSIDTRTEKLIEAGMDKLMEGRTVFVIAHRLSTVRNSQAIMVLEHGEIIERGEHESLIAQRGKYYQLYTGAFELD